LPLTLYHNNGNGTFTDVSSRSGLEKFVGRALGVVAIDVNDDGWPDLFVARDASPNLLLINKKDGTFDDIALDAEVAYDSNGTAKAGMGVDAGDVNGDGIPDFVVTNFSDQYHSLFWGSLSLPFQDRTIASHLAQYSNPTWDGVRSLLTTTMMEIWIQGSPMDTSTRPLRQPATTSNIRKLHLLRNDGKGISERCRRRSSF
jgi:hypothetical protein